jgi:uncharacterized protein YjhX (UPF0386 family)
VKKEPHRGGLGQPRLSRRKKEEKKVQEINVYCNLGVMSQDKSLVIKTLKRSELIAESQNKKKN